MKNSPSVVSWEVRNSTKIDTIDCFTQLCVHRGIWIVIAAERVQNIEAAAVLYLTVVDLRNLNRIVIWVLICRLPLAF